MVVRRQRPPIGLAWIITWPLGAVFAAVAFLAANELRRPGLPGDVSQPTASAEWNERLPARIAALETSLRKGPLALGAAIEEERGSGALRYKYRRYTVQLVPGDRPRAEAAIETARTVDAGLTVSTVEGTDETEVRFGLDGLLVANLRVLWREHPEDPPRLAVIIGPLGDDLRQARYAIEGLDAPIVLGIRPQRPFSRQVAELGKIFEREAIVQLDRGGDTVAPTPAEAEVQPLEIGALLAAVPGAVGVAWSGSDAAVARPDQQLMAELDRRHLLFVGARGEAQNGGLPAPVVLSATETEPHALDEQLLTAGLDAEQRGRVVIMAPPTDGVLTALQQALPQWRARGVEVVPVSVLSAGGALRGAPAPTLSHR
jgi:polysaccharide deacetylase 2 family uncharacterized protein YibQ